MIRMLDKILAIDTDTLSLYEVKTIKFNKSSDCEKEGIKKISEVYGWDMDNGGQACKLGSPILMIGDVFEIIDLKNKLLN